MGRLKRYSVEGYTLSLDESEYNLYFVIHDVRVFEDKFYFESEHTFIHLN